MKEKCGWKNVKWITILLFLQIFLPKRSISAWAQKNPQEFAEINAEIINFVAENIRNAAENKKIANLTGYARAALRRGKADYDTACEASGTSRTDSYGATYDIAAYENYSAADNPEWNDWKGVRVWHVQNQHRHGRKTNIIAIIMTASTSWFRQAIELLYRL